jgi:hypothetical protein
MHLHLIFCRIGMGIGDWDPLKLAKSTQNHLLRLPASPMWRVDNFPYQRLPVWLIWEFAQTIFPGDTNDKLHRRYGEL